MAEVLDLSKLKKDKPAEEKKPDQSDAAFEALSDEEKARLLNMAEENGVEADNRTPVHTAFVVFVDLDGNTHATVDLAVVDSIRPSRPATADDIYSGTSIIRRDIEAELSGQHAAMAMQNMAMVAQQRMQEAQIAARLKQEPRG